MILEANLKGTNMKNYSDIFAKYEARGGNEKTKHDLLMRFLDLHSNAIVTPHLFDDYLSEISEVENSCDKDQEVRSTFALGITDGLEADELSSGMTYEDQDLNEAYDHGVIELLDRHFMGQQRDKNEKSPR
jgi:hypothetical protein